MQMAVDFVGLASPDCSSTAEAARTTSQRTDDQITAMPDQRRCLPPISLFCPEPTRNLPHSPHSHTSIHTPTWTACCRSLGSWAAEMQNLARRASRGVAGKPTTTTASPLARHMRWKADMMQGWYNMTGCSSQGAGGCFERVMQEHKLLDCCLVAQRGSRGQRVISRCLCR